MRPIGIFDSGIGGLSVARAVTRRLPHESVLYVADHAHVPYGHRTASEVAAFSDAIVRWLRDADAKAVVVACNTATSAAVEQLRAQHPELPIVGIEPALKVAVAQSVNHVVGVVATQGTLHGKRLADLESRFGGRTRLLKETPAGLVERIERGEVDGADLEAYLTEEFRPLLDAKVDCLVLGCTHYPLVAPVIKRVVGDRIRLIEPSEAVGQQVARLLPADEACGNGAPRRQTFYTTGTDLPLFARQVQLFLGVDRPDCRRLAWSASGSLVCAV
ncbi:MAG: glutamate racemase [Planctomycetota bacterium]